MKKEKNPAGAVLMAFLVLFFYAPIIYTIVFSFNSGRSLTHFSGFSLQWYKKMFNDDTMMSSLGYTITIAVIATVVSTILGTVTAIGLSKSKKIIKSVVEQINQLPIMNPEIVTGVGLLMFFSSLHIKRGFMTLLLAHIMFCTPYVILSIGPKIRSLNPNLADAAMDLGATPIQAMTKVIIPEIMPGIFSGALIAFTMSFDDFVISHFVTGIGVSNISIIVYTMSRRVNPSINALSTLVIVILSVVLLLANAIPAMVEHGKSKRIKQARPE